MLSGKQRRFLRGLGHHLEPVVHVGKLGVEPGVIAALDRALLDHELVKVKIGQQSPMDRDQVADALASNTGAEVAQILGHSILLYRPHPEDPTIKLPPGKAAAAGAGALADDDDEDDDLEG